MQDILTSNPVPRIDRPRVKEKELRYLKHSQVIRLLRSVHDTRDRLIIRLIYATGVRVSELCAIQVEDIDIDDQVIRVRGKGGKIRMVFVDQETLDDIGQAIADRLIGPLFSVNRVNPSLPEPSSTYSASMLLPALPPTRSDTAMQVSSTGDPRTSVWFRRISGTRLLRQPRYISIQILRNDGRSIGTFSRLLLPPGSLPTNYGFRQATELRMNEQHEKDYTNSRRFMA